MTSAVGKHFEYTAAGVGGTYIVLSYYEDEHGLAPQDEDSSFIYRLLRIDQADDEVWIADFACDAQSAATRTADMLARFDDPRRQLDAWTPEPEPC